MMYTLKQLNAGNYSLRLMATSQAGNGEYTPYYYFYVEEFTTTSPVQVFGYAFIGLTVNMFGQ